MTDVVEAELAAAAAYEDLFVPALFRAWAPKLADAAAVGRGQRVLDVATGTGIVAREVRRRVGDGGFVAGVDRAPGMLAVARRFDPGIDFREGSAEMLPWPDDAFDAVLCQFGLMFFEDRSRALREMWRVLVTQGRFAVAVWASLDQMPAFAIEVALLERLAGKPAADALRAPFCLGDHDTLMRLFPRNRFSSFSVTTESAQAQFPSIRAMVEADLRGWLPLMGVSLDEDQIARVLRAAEEELADFRTREGALVFDSRAHIVAGAKT